MNQCNIRLATEQDADEINAVSKFLGYSDLSDSECKEKLAEMIASDHDEVYVAEISDKIVGWMHLFYSRRLASDSFYEIGGLVVDPEFRRQGIGNQLVKTAIKNHTGKLRVRCNESRTEAHRFYEQLDFVSHKNQRVFELKQ